MEKMIEMTVNQLPAPTWNWLHMNDSQLKIDTQNSKMKVDVQIPSNEIQYSENCVRELGNCATGMGEEISQVMEESKSDVLHFEVKEGAIIEKPMILHFDYQDQSAYHDVELIAHKNSSLTVIMAYTSKKEVESCVSNGVRTRVQIEQGAKVRLIQVQLLNQECVHFNDMGGLCQEKGQLELLQIKLGSKESYSGCRVELVGNESEFHSQIGYIGKQNQRFDMNYIVNHYGKKTKSSLKADGVLDDSAAKIFRGTIDFKNGSSGSEGEEQEDVLLLGDNIINQTIPLILCAEEDVQGNHGATIGQIDDEVLFYLCSRGMSKEEAQSMIVQARIDTLCAKIPDEQIVAMIETFRQED